MHRQKHDKPDHWEREIRIALVLVGAVILLIVALFSIQIEKRDIKKKASEMLELVKYNCQKYNDYQLGITTKDLQIVINKANMLSTYTTNMDISRATVLRRYATNQYLSGIIILDGNTEVVSSVDLNGMNNGAILEQIRDSGQLQDILVYPQKVYADHIVWEGHTYDYAVVARKSVRGLIICYTDTTQFQADKYEISLSNMLDIESLGQDAVMVITDGEKVISTSAAGLEGLSVEECPVTNVVTGDLMQEDRSLIKLRYNGRIWYGKQDIYRDYYLYVFYSADSVLSGVLFRGVLALGIYLLFCLLVALFLQYRRRENMRQLEKEYHLNNAIASIYNVNLLIHIRENTWEPLLQTEKLDGAIRGQIHADGMFDTICEEFIMESGRAAFRQFTDLHTIQERMHGKRFLGYSFETIHGKWYQSLLVPQGHNEYDEVTEVMFLLRNVSEQKNKELHYQEQLRITAQQAAFANAAKTDFLRRMSHDIRTPINGIRGMAEIGVTCLQDEKRTGECFEKILTSSDFLLELVNNVLDMSKLETGETQLTKEAFDLRKVLHSTDNIIASQAKAAEIQYESAAPVGKHWHLIGSPLNIQRVFQNILGNAVKYNRPGGTVQVSCRETACDENMATYTFICADTGIGMSPEFQSQAFDTFAQEHRTARTTYEGSGLGLAIAKKTVDLMGGTISFVSTEGKGTVFTVILPLQIDHAYEEKKSEERKEAESLQGIRILLAEDNEINREIADYMLTEKGAVVTDAQDGRQAVELFQNAKAGDFDVILMDIMMPVMNGLEAARAIRAMDRPDAKTIPIIAVTANAFSDDIAATKASGMNEHLSKPLNFAEVSSVIHKYVDSDKNQFEN